MLFPNFIISKCNLIENTDTFHNIFTLQTGINFFLFEEETWSVVQKCCPMRWPRRPTLPTFPESLTHKPYAFVDTA